MIICSTLTNSANLHHQDCVGLDQIRLNKAAHQLSSDSGSHAAKTLIGAQSTWHQLKGLFAASGSVLWSLSEKNDQFVFVLSDRVAVGCTYFFCSAVCPLSVAVRLSVGLPPPASLSLLSGALCCWRTRFHSPHFLLPSAPRSAAASDPGLILNSPFETGWKPAFASFCPHVPSSCPSCQVSNKLLL